MAAQFHSFQRDPLHEEWVGVEPQIREEEIDETVETDILIIGAGLAGVAAAREATEHMTRCPGRNPPHEPSRRTPAARNSRKSIPARPGKGAARR